MSRSRVVAPFAFTGLWLVTVLLPRLPRAVLFRLCDVLAAVCYALDRRGRRQALENVRSLRDRRPVVAYSRFDADSAPYNPSRREARIVRGSYRNMVRAVGIAFWIVRDTARRVRALSEMDETCRRFLAAHHRAGRPVITVSGHFGCWELLSQLALLEGHAMLSVAKDLSIPCLTKLLVRVREAGGQEIVPVEGAFRTLLAGLAKGQSLGLLIDQHVDPKDGGRWVRFCGRPLPVSHAPALLAARARATIVLAWARPLSGGRYRCSYLGEISPDEARDVRQATQRCLSILEHLARRHPSRWVLNYNLFSHIPDARDEAELLI